jgi:hypothetical protein
MGKNQLSGIRGQLPGVSDQYSAKIFFVMPDLIRRPEGFENTGFLLSLE